jgi:hypothetical protein
MNTLEQAIQTTTRLLREGRLRNEQTVSQSVVLRILSSLGWDVFEPLEVMPEFATGEGRVDFALCHPPSRPKVFIEVKQPGRAEGGVRQALQYAFTTGVPFVVLTDGQTWSFYLPAEQGAYEERRVYMLDLYERAEGEAAEVLRKFLDRDRVRSDAALESARADYRGRNRREQARVALPKAWRDLVDGGNETLVELLSEVVESHVGVRPSADDVALYLRGLGSMSNATSAPRPAPAADRKDTGTLPSSLTPTVPGGALPLPGVVESTPIGARAGVARVRGERIVYQNAKEAMVLVLRAMAASDPGLLERLSGHPRIVGRTRRYIARSPEELYPEREDLREFHEQLPGGWLVATNLNNVLKGAIVQAACEVGGLMFGRDVLVEF